MFWFALLGFLRPAIQIFLLPFYLIYLTPEDYGLLAMVSVFTSIICVLATLRLDAAVRTFYFDYNDDMDKLWKYLSQTFSLIIIVGSCIYLVLLILGPSLFKLIFESDEITFYPYGILSISAGFLTTFSTVYFIYLKNEVRLKEYFMYSIGMILATILFQLIFVVYFELGVVGILYGHIIAAALIFTTLSLRNMKLYTSKFSKEMIFPSLKFTIPLLPFAFLYRFELQLDKLMIERFLGLERVGQYAILMGIVGMIGILMMAMNNAMRPFLYRSLKAPEGNTTEQVNSFLQFYLFIGVLGLSGIILVGSNLELFTDNEKYLAIQPYFILAAIASIPLIIVRYFTLIFIYYKKSKDLTLVTIVKTLIMFLLMFLLIPKYEINGAIISISISYLLNAFIFYFLNVNYGMPKIEILKALRIILLFVGIVLGSFYFIDSIRWVGVIQFLLVWILLILFSIPLIKEMARMKITK
jgi:O-antigen/teichoic acid export membrane protein